jgi:hypothetical protein
MLFFGGIILACCACVLVACICSRRRTCTTRKNHCTESGYNRLQPTVTTVHYGTTTTAFPPPPYRLPLTQDVYFSTNATYVPSYPVMNPTFAPNYTYAPIAPTAPSQGQLYPQHQQQR